MAPRQPPRQRTAAAASVRKPVKAAYQPYQPPIDGPSLYPPLQQQAKVCIIALMLLSASLDLQAVQTQLNFDAVSCMMVVAGSLLLCRRARTCVPRTTYTCPVSSVALNMSVVHG